ncbi:MAG: CBS domain-containing protein [Chloroflexota bacterium]
MKISRILATKSREPITIGPQQTLKDVVDLLVEHRIGALPVVDPAGKLVGIISERDFIRQAAVKGGQVFSLRVSEVMTREVVVGVPQDDAIVVAHTMTEKRFRHLPIVEKGRLVGIVSIGDILKAQRDEYQGALETLETHILADE